MEKRLRFKFAKTGMLKYLSHLDIINIIIRAMRRARILAKYTEGFNPKPKITFGPPIPLGVESQAEYADVIIIDDISPEDFISAMNEKLEDKIIISDAQDLPPGVKSLMGQLDIAEYEIIIGGNGKGEKIHELAKRVVVDLNMQDPVYEMGIVKGGNDPEDILLIVYGFTRTAKDRNAKVFKLRDFMKGLTSVLKSKNLYIKRILKKELYVLKDGKKLTPFEVLKLYV
jgi:radical SAM-linked protein